MNDFDKYIKAIAKEEKRKVPESVKRKVHETLSNLPENKEKTKTAIHAIRFLRVAAVVFCVVFVTVFLFPNISVAYAKAAEDVPVIGEIVKAVTIRNYFNSDGENESDTYFITIETETDNAEETDEETS